MPSPTYSQAFTPDLKKKVYWAVEATTAGTAPSLSAASTWFTEGVVDFSFQPQRSRYTGTEYVGVAVTPLTSVEINHHETLTVKALYRPGGFVEKAMALFCGDITNTGTQEVSGSVDPVSHAITPGLASTRCATFSLILDTGAGTTNALLFTYSTLSSIDFAMDPSQPLMVTLNFTSRWHSVTTLPTTPTGVTTNRLLSTQGTIALKSNAGTTYTAKPISGNLTITRAGPDVTFSVANASKDPLDIFPGALSVTGSMDFIYDSLQSGTPYADFVNDLAMGASGVGNANTFSWSDSGTHGITIEVWPMKWDQITVPTASGNAAHISGQFTAFQDEGKATQATPALSILQKVTLINATAAGLCV